MMIGQKTQSEKEYRQKEYAFFWDYLDWLLLNNNSKRIMMILHELVVSLL